MHSHRFSLPCIRTSLGLAVLATTLLASPSFAAEKPAQVKGQWAVNMVQGEKKEFAYCLARAPYNNGLQLAIAMSPKHELNVGVMVPDAGYTAGDKYPMTISIDGKFKRTRPGIAAQPQLLMVPMGPDKDALGALRGGKVLAVEGPEDIAYFTLSGTGKALQGLQQCVDVGTGKIKAPPMPAAGAPGTAATASAAPAGKASGKAPKFPQGLLQLLKSAGLKDLTLVEIPDPAKAPVDFAWRTEGVLGGLRERPVPADVTLEKMSSIIEQGYKKQCSGAFKSNLGTAETLPGVELRKADFGCEMNGQGAEVALLLYITDTHLFSMFMHEAHGVDKEKAHKARDAITAQIRKLAKEQQPKAGVPAASGPIPPNSTPIAAPTGPIPPNSVPAAAPSSVMNTAPAAPAPAATAPAPSASPSPWAKPTDAATPPPAVNSNAAPPPAVGATTTTTTTTTTPAATDKK